MSRLSDHPLLLRTSELGDAAALVHVVQIELRVNHILIVNLLLVYHYVLVAGVSLQLLYYELSPLRS